MPEQRLTYAIQAVDGGPVKIGSTTERNLPARLDLLQSGNPRSLTVRGVVNEDIERDLHVRFAALRLRANGEWFHAAPELGQVFPGISMDDHDSEAAVMEWKRGFGVGWARALHWANAKVQRTLEVASNDLRLTLDFEGLDLADVQADATLSEIDRELFRVEERERLHSPG